LLSPLWIGLALLCCAAKSPVTPPVVPLGDNTYSITREATNAFHRDTDKLKAEVEADAGKFCTDQGKQMKVVSLTAEKPWFSTGYCTAKIVFKAVVPGEPEPTSASAAPAVTESAERPTATGDLYSDLLKLDDLRKKGILTDKEFQSEKKKILNRSR
jgi:hypothetical protein